MRLRALEAEQQARDVEQKLVGHRTQRRVDQVQQVATVLAAAVQASELSPAPTAAASKQQGKAAHSGVVSMDSAHVAAQMAASSAVSDLSAHTKARRGRVSTPAARAGTGSPPAGFREKLRVVDQALSSPKRLRRPSESPSRRVRFVLYCCCLCLWLWL